MASGFTVSAVLVYALLWMLGTAAGVSQLPESARLLMVGGACVVFSVLDSPLWDLNQHSLSWHRQTPRNAFHLLGPTRGSLLWGLDTGLAFTTYRVTTLTWMAFSATVLHLVPWWSGIVYATAYAVPTLLDILTTSKRRPRHLAYMSFTTGWERHIRRGALALSSTTATACVVVGVAWLSGK